MSRIYSTVFEIYVHTYFRQILKHGSVPGVGWEPGRTAECSETMTPKVWE